MCACAIRIGFVGRFYYFCRMTADSRAYETKDFTVDMEAGEYWRLFHDAVRVRRFCARCPNFGRSWACPPFDREAETGLRSYRRVLLITTKIIPSQGLDEGASSRELIACQRERVERRLFEMERECDGRALTAVGSCTECDGLECSRLHGTPCRHPERVRPSLEAYGFDVGRTVADLFGMRILWSRGGRVPEYLLLVCALFYNSDSAEF